MADTNLRGKATIEGAQQAAADLEKIASAQDKLTEAQETTTRSTEKATASAEDYTQTLGRIHPALGEYADGLSKATRIADDLSKKQFSVKQLAKSAAGGLAKMAGSIKLLGAGAIAFVGFEKLIKSINDVRQAIDLAEQSMRKFIETQTKMAEAAAAAAQQVSAVVDANKRQHPLTFAQEESLRLTLEAAPEDVKESIKPIIGALGGAKGFGPAPGEFTGAELAMLARTGFQIEPEAPQRFTVRAARRHLERRAGDIATINQREEDRKAAMTQRAVNEVLGSDLIGTRNIDAIVAPIAERYGVEPTVIRDESIKVLKRDFQTLRDARNVPGGLRGAYLRWHGNAGVPPDQRITTPDIREWMPFMEGNVSVLGTPYLTEGQGESAVRRPTTPIEIAAITEVFKELIPIIRKIAEQPTIVQHNPRNYGYDATLFKQRCQNSGALEGRF